MLAASDLPVLLSGDSTLVHRALQLPGPREDGLVVDDDGFDQLVYVRLGGDLVVALGDRHQRGAEANSQVVGVHHVVIAVLRQARERERGRERGGS